MWGLTHSGKQFHNSVTCTNKIYYLKFDKILAAFRIGLQSTQNESGHKAQQLSMHSGNNKKWFESKFYQI